MALRQAGTQPCEDECRERGDARAGKHEASMSNAKSRQERLHRSQKRQQQGGGAGQQSMRSRVHAKHASRQPLIGIMETCQQGKG